ncbi:hypothetical protein [Rhizobium sp. MHM7A]|uniref:hypothetical protein n=1 Tax=Rhizobium sp. MHM7A TaxID=2583233 RepID=UPI0011062444|nr:hypothetical protein [Rhizobium sp. MHM7A]TLX17192.1 hypothetical protein FFR93_07735 [Rhizobium sp. MHM7A]
MKVDENLIAVAEILTSHVSSGKSYSSDIAELKSLVPLAYRKAPRDLFRTVAISVADHDRLNSDGSINLVSPPFTSWTSSIDVAVRHARGIARTGNGFAVLVVKREIDAQQIVADVEAIFRAVGWDHPDVEEWDLYASKEKEFIVEMDDNLTVVRLADCQHQFLDLTHPLLHPAPGDQIWSQDDGVFLEVDEVIATLDEDRPLTFRALVSDDTECSISWDAAHLCWNLNERFAPTYEP